MAPQKFNVNTYWGAADSWGGAPPGVLVILTVGKNPLEAESFEASVRLTGLVGWLVGWSWTALSTQCRSKTVLNTPRLMNLGISPKRLPLEFSSLQRGQVSKSPCPCLRVPMLIPASVILVRVVSIYNIGHQKVARLYITSIWKFNNFCSLYF